MPTQTDGQVEETQSEETTEELSTSEQPTEETETQEVDQPQENPEELPEDVKERTKKEFEKLKNHNAELKRQLEEQRNIPSVLDYLSGPLPQIQPEVRQQYVPQQVSQFVPQPIQQPKEEERLVNEEGYVNATVLEKQLEAAKEARRKAEDAEKRAMEAQERIARFEQDAEQRELYKEYPELDPLNENFNREAYELVRDRLTNQIVQTGKRNAIQAAREVEKYFRTPKQNQQVLQQRQQVSQPVQSAPRPTNMTDLDELKLRSRHDPAAVNERLKRLGM